MVHLQKLHEKYRDRELAILGFNCSDDKHIAMDFLRLTELLVSRGMLISPLSSCPVDALLFFHGRLGFGAIDKLLNIYSIE